jgi:hypothetical protein
MTKLGRLCFWVGFLVYAASFWLTAMVGAGTSKPPSLADLVIDSLLVPPDLHSSVQFWDFLGGLNSQKLVVCLCGMDKSDFHYHGGSRVGRQNPQAEQSLGLRSFTVMFIPVKAISCGRQGFSWFYSQVVSALAGSRQSKAVRSTYEHAVTSNFAVRRDFVNSAVREFNSYSRDAFARWMFQFLD